MTYTVNDMVEVRLRNSETFLVVKETLSRIGIASKRDNTLYQSVHILHKKGHYYLCSFKELFALDGKPTNITEDDLARRNTIINLLVQWGLVEVVNPDLIKETMSVSQIKIVKFSEKESWTFVQKYNVGSVKGKPQSEQL